MSVQTRSRSKMSLNPLISIDGKNPDQLSEECSICCEKVSNKAFVSDCLHYFCYKCILQWIKVRAVCPLCVQPIHSIIKNIRSVDDYDVQAVVPPEIDVLSTSDNDLELWGNADDYLNDDNNFEINAVSSDETVPSYSSTDSDENPADNDMDENSDGASNRSFSFSYASDDDMEESDVAGSDMAGFSNSEDEVKSSESYANTNNSDMEDEDDWQLDVADNENETENEESNYSTNYSEENDDSTSNNSNNQCDSDDNFSEEDDNSDEYTESAASEDHTDVESSNSYYDSSDDY